MSLDTGEPPLDDSFTSARERMVREQLVSRGVRDPATLAAMGLVPREAFVPEGRQDDAYSDGPLSIGRGQTISQPYMVARMTELLGLSDLGWPWTGTRPPILDVGTGSGYQAAVLAQCGAHVTSVECQPELAAAARARLASLGYDVEVLDGDGSAGYPEHAPYAGIIVAAGSPDVPGPLLEQLAEGARLVVPVGSHRMQRLTVVRRTGQHTETRTADGCVFVPLLGRYGYPG
ncbi:MAG: protein-L-isoaspartate(D-aspartate) O-methyltransferase [Chloroflexota bacterium]|nr:protein-L-isoaspartate(D-aspartate) O-methyltransferase [Chloroflexota bacterium]